MLKNNFDSRIFFGICIFVFIVSIGILTAEMQLNKLTLKQPGISEEAMQYYHLLAEDAWMIYHEGNDYLEQVVEKIKVYQEEKL